MTRFELDKLVRDAMASGKSKVFLRDGSGLYIRIREFKSGKNAFWMYDYAPGKPKSLGPYKTTNITDARAALMKFKSELLNGGPRPSEKLKAVKVEALTVEAVCREWFDRKMIPGEVAETTRKDTRRKLEMYVLPTIGGKSIAEVSNDDILGCLRKIEAAKKIPTELEVFKILCRVFTYARGAGYSQLRPDDISEALPKKPPAKHFKGVEDPAELADILRKLDAFTGGQYQYRIMLRLLPHLALRVSSLIQAEWSQFDMATRVWTLPAEAMKGRTGQKRMFREPLSKQVCSMLEDLRRHTGNTPYLFPCGKGKPPARSVIGYWLKQAGVHPSVATPHGFRTTMSTLMRNELHLNDTLPELALAHAVGNTVQRAYDRADRLEERREAMQRWSDYLDRLKAEK